ncbi:MAG: YdhK family protein [Actinomycetales bacterium]
MSATRWKQSGARLAAGVFIAAVLATGCASADTAESSSTATQTATTTQQDSGHAGMDHAADGGPVPEGMTPATNPTYPIGTTVTVNADHSDGMMGSTATVVGAYDTYTYAVDYTPTTGGDPVTDHRWVVQQEILDAGDERLADGTQVTLAADHMDGMDGATATIVSSTDETVYVIDYEADGMMMTNHKWVVESELQPAS